jgi:aminopeptidase-like protein
MNISLGAKLTEVLKTRKLKPRERYVVLTQTIKAVAYLHKHNLTPFEHISANVLMLLMDKKVMFRMISINASLEKVI